MCVCGSGRPLPPRPTRVLFIYLAVGRSHPPATHPRPTQSRSDRDRDGGPPRTILDPPATHPGRLRPTQRLRAAATHPEPPRPTQRKCQLPAGRRDPTTTHRKTQVDEPPMYAWYKKQGHVAIDKQYNKHNSAGCAQSNRQSTARTCYQLEELRETPIREADKRRL